jgi:hypothetical protein
MIAAGAAMMIGFNLGDERLALREVARCFARESEGRMMPLQYQN